MAAKKITILGAGSWGTALALLAARNGCQTLLWGHNPAHVQALADSRQNQRYLPGHPFPDTLSVTTELAEAAAFSDLILVSVPSHAFKSTLLALKPHLSRQPNIAWASKGFNPDDGSLLHAIVADIFSPETPAAILSGPTFAGEVAANLPTAITIASAQPAFAKQLADILHGGLFRTYPSTDVIGVEVGG
ncbi:MAG: NAD(P)H-dependent glycerol-3-phosphate dehydrogenase, partial [Methylococcaceae bacterium]|nr:NAD(P)H-dependent glycerol-3-phosphate dehydrogenase [Methylococcaceae bacterium]